MTDNAVREHVRRYVDEVTPARLPAFESIAVRRRQRHVRQALASASAAAVVAAVVILAAVLGGGSARPTATVTPPATPTGSASGPATASARPVAPSLTTAADLRKALVGPSWRLAFVQGAGTYWHPRAESTATLSFTGTDFQATDGCDSVQSAVAFGDDGAVTFGGKDSSNGACSLAAPGPPPGTFPPQLFENALQGPMTASVDDGVLTLTDGATVLVLTSGNATFDDPNAGDKLQALLTSHTWPLHLITSSGKTWGDPQKAVLQFGAHGYVIDPDCNTHSGAVSYAAGRLVMQSFMQTTMGCAANETVQARSADVIDALFKGPVSVEEDTGLLMLWNDKTYLELHEGPAPKADLGLDLPPASGAPTSGAPTSTAAASPLESSLTGARWMLRTATVGGKEVPEADDFGASLTFAGSSFHVDDGCNTSTGAVVYDATGVQLTAGFETAADCPNGHGVRDAQRYAGHYDVKVEGSTLTLTGSDHAFVYDAQGHAAFASQLVGTEWRLVAWRKHGSEHQVPAGVRAGISFEDGVDRYLSVSDGCNSFVANAQYNGAHIKAIRGQVTTKQCGSVNNQIMGNVRLGLDSDVSAFVTPTTLSLNGNGVYLVLERSTPKYELASTATPSPQTTGETSLVGPTFMLRKLTVNGVDLPRVAAIGATVTYASTTFTATDGCNDLQGSVRYEADSILPADVAGSAMLCPGARFQQDSHAFDAVLGQKVTVVRHADGLTLTAAGTVAELAVEDPASLPRDLLAGAWQVTTVSTVEGVAARSIDASPARLTFTGDAFRLDDGCNTVSGTVLYGPVSLTFTKQSRTTVPCAATAAIAILRKALATVTQGESSLEHEAGSVWLRVGDTSVGFAPVVS